MTRANQVGIVCIGLATALLVLSGVVSATNFGWAVGATSITGSTCTATISSVVPTTTPYYLTWTDHDTLVVQYNISWSDTRTSSSPQATHYFHVKAQWGVSLWDEQSHWENTTGSSSGSGTLTATVLDARIGYVIDVTWDISLTSGATCSPSDQKLRTIILQH